MVRTRTRLCLVRHGETAWNAERRLQGHLDVELNEHGLRQAALTARVLATAQFEAAYSSDLRRARLTAEIIAGGPLPVTIDAGLRERHYGCFQGLTYTEAEARFPEDYARFLARDSQLAFSGGGESLQTFANRIKDTLVRIVAAHPGQQVLIVTHGGVLDIIHRLTTGSALDAARDFTIPNAALNWIEHEDDEWRLISWGDQRHLDSSLDELSNA
ncbi:MAG: histidine phosphatase family protein [Azoarcus sp.]|nr:histidine phosphatase family protein [Azoarcus sp.]